MSVSVSECSSDPECGDASPRGSTPSPRSGPRSRSRSRSRSSGAAPTPALAEPALESGRRSSASSWIPPWARPKRKGSKAPGPSRYLPKGRPSDATSEAEHVRRPSLPAPPAPALGALALDGDPRWPLLTLTLVGSVLLVAQGVAAGPTCLWIGAGHFGLALAVVAWVLVRGAARERALLVTLGDEAAEIVVREPFVAGDLAQDPRVHYVQACVRRRMAEAVFEKKEAQIRAVDPMYYVRQDMTAWDESEAGYTVIDGSGVILFVNKAMCRYFGHPKAQMVGENVRLLMPSSYASQHDFFLKKHLETGAAKVIGRERAVPILKADGTQAVVHLAVEQLEVPAEHESRLFLGVMRFKHEDEATKAFQRGIKKGRAVAEAAEPFEGKAVPTIVTEVDGTVQYINAACEALLGWPRAELLGKNVKVLMGEPYASHHDQFLRRYLEKAQAGGAGQAVRSNIVGSGRDVVAKQRNGQSVRVFLMVDRVDRLSGSACDCLFLASMPKVAEASNFLSLPPSRNHSPRSGNSPLSPRSGTARSARSSHSRASSSWSRAGSALSNRSHYSQTGTASIGSTFYVVKAIAKMKRNMKGSSATSPRSNMGLLHPLALKKCTVVMADVWGLYQPTSRCSSHTKSLTQNYHTFLDSLDAACKQNRGCLQSLVGDRAVLTFNATVPNTSHRPSAAHAMLQLQKGCRLLEFQSMRLHVAAVTGECHYGQWDKQPIVIGQAVDVCDALLRVAAEARAAGSLIDASLHEELQYSFQCRMVNAVTVQPATPAARTYEVYELQARKTLATDEWMYQISAAAEADPLVAWKRCWQCLQAGGDGAGWYRAALEALADFIVEQKAPDPTAAWLERVLQHRCAEEAAGAHARPIMAGKHQVLVHYSLDNAADGVRAALREPFLRPRLGIFDAPQINVEEDGVLLCQDIS